MRRAFIIIGALAGTLPASLGTAQQVPVVTDSRIKTLVYNENDVYPLVTHYGYQSNVEFGPKEKIETISIGDRTGWQIIPAGRRLFVRPLEEGAHTNMTVITSLRTYQFDLASETGELRPNESLVYVVRFYYPDEALARVPDVGARMPAAYASQVPPSATGESSASPENPLSAASMAAPAPGPNYRYTFTGPDALAPQKIYDDGQSTYLILSGDPSSVTVVGADGRANSATLEEAGADGTRRINAVGRRIDLHYGNETVTIFNEAS